VIGVGIIGAGHFGAVHARALSGLTNARLVAACRNEVASIGRFVAEHGGRAYTDWCALLDDPSVDAVVIATPHDLHRDIAIACLAAGKHVLLEKPMAITIADCDAIADAATMAPGSLMIGHVPRYFAPMQAAAEVIASGRIGRPVAGTSAFIKLWMEGNRQPWHLSATSGGGMLMTAGIHALDRLLHLMGGPVESVGALMGTAFHNQDADDIAFLNLRFADGRLGQVTSLGYADGAVTAALQIVGEHGTLVLDLNGRLQIGQNGVWQDLPCPTDEDPMVAAVRRQWQAFLGAITEGKPPPIDARYGRHLVAIIAAARQSSRDRKEILVETTPQ
jgi:phthalate 4,5-cis-dihydrodiol dehydrogenase